MCVVIRSYRLSIVGEEHVCFFLPREHVMLHTNAYCSCCTDPSEATRPRNKWKHNTSTAQHTTPATMQPLFVSRNTTCQFSHYDAAPMEARWRQSATNASCWLLLGSNLTKLMLPADSPEGFSRDRSRVSTGSTQSPGCPAGARPLALLSSSPGCPSAAAWRWLLPRLCGRGRDRRRRWLEPCRRDSLPPPPPPPPPPLCWSLAMLRAWAAARRMPSALEGCAARG